MRQRRRGAEVGGCSSQGIRFKANLTSSARLSQATHLKGSNINPVLSPSIHHSEMRAMLSGSFLT